MDISYFLSKLLGGFVVAFSLFTKVPQIIAIYNARSGFGVSTLSFVIEIFLYSINIAYHFILGLPATTYLEYVFLLIQDLVIILLITYYARAFTAQFVAGAGVWLVFTVVAIADLLPSVVLSTLQSSATFVFIIAKFPQIYSNYKNKSTGSLSAVMMAALTTGNAIRIFTTITEAGSNLELLVGYSTGFFFNGLILAQIIYYGSTPSCTASQPSSTPSTAAETPLMSDDPSPADDHAKTN